MKARFLHSTWVSTKTSKSTQHLMAQLSMWMQETLLWVSPVYGWPRVPDLCIHPGLHTSRQVQNCMPKPGDVAEEQHCCYPLLCTYLQSSKGGVRNYMSATRLLGVRCVNHLRRRKYCTARPIRSFIHMMMACSLGARSWATLFLSAPACSDKRKTRHLIENHAIKINSTMQIDNRCWQLTRKGARSPKSFRDDIFL